MASGTPLSPVVFTHYPTLSFISSTGGASSVSASGTLSSLFADGSPLSAVLSNYLFLVVASGSLSTISGYLLSFIISGGLLSTVSGCLLSFVLLVVFCLLFLVVFHHLLLVVVLCLLFLVVILYLLCFLLALGHHSWLVFHLVHIISLCPPLRFSIFLCLSHLHYLPII